MTRIFLFYGVSRRLVVAIIGLEWDTRTGVHLYPAAFAPLLSFRSFFLLSFSFILKYRAYKLRRLTFATRIENQPYLFNYRRSE